MNIAKYLGPDYPTAEALLAATSYNAHQIVSHRAYLVQENLLPRELPVSARAPGRATNDVSRYVTEIKPDANVANTTARSVEFTFEAFPGFESVNLIRDLVQITYVYFTPQGTVLREVSLGYFSFVFPKETYTDALLLWNVQGQDLTSRLARKGFLNTMTFPSGLPVTTAMSAMVQMDKLPPSRGGRKPSGVVWPGTPQSKLPVNQSGPNTYAPTGVHVSTVATLIDGGMYWSTPAGTYGALLYNALTDPLVDPVSFAPIDPWTHQPMPQAEVRTGFTGPGVFIAGYGNLLYLTVTGFFVYATSDLSAVQPGGGVIFATGPAVVTAIDPYKLQPIPAGDSYKFLVQAGSGPLETWGTLDLPLNTWQYDYDHSGPYFETIAATADPIPAPTAPTTTLTATHELDVPPVAGGVTIATRWANGSGPLVLIAGSKKVGVPDVCAPDPLRPGFTWCQVPDAGGSWSSGQVDVSNFVIPPGTWFVTVLFAGGPLLAGSVTCSLQFSLGGTVLGSGSALVDWSTNRASIEVEMNGVSGGTLSCQVELSGTVTAQPNIAGPQYNGALDYEGLICGLPDGATQSQTVPGSAGTVLPPLAVSPTVPSQSATWVPWPDTNNPAITPAGCETIGPNLPADRIRIVPRDAVFPSPYPLSTKMGFAAGFNQLAQTIQYHNVLFDTDGNLVCGPSIFSTDTPPTPVLRLSTRANSSLNIHPGVEKILLDQTTIANVFAARSEPNQNLPPLKSVAWNDSPDSYVSIENAGDTILRSAQVDTILDQGVLDDYARVELDWAAIGQLGLTLTCWPIPWLELYDCITVEIISPEGEVIVYADERHPFVVTQFSMDIHAKTMQIVCNRWVPL